MATLNDPIPPRFAVVGHPNKGKSTIVSALAMDRSVQISDTPGTTTRTRSFPLRVDGDTVYILYDTPGFQRARQVLAWLEQHTVRADQRPDVVRAFLREHRDDARFADEVELLGPIMEGAGILYVVDGSRPYSDEYEAEMEILRWSGQPSMALINKIDTTDHTDIWKRALEQYFKLVRTYDPIQGGLEDHIRLLEAMAQLNESWTDAMRQAIDLLQQQRESVLAQSAMLLARLVAETIQHTESLRIAGEAPRPEDEATLTQRYQKALRTLERRAHHRIADLWRHDDVHLAEEELPLEGLDLFAQESASLFGLTQQEMIVAGTVGGAAAGAGIDLLLAGHTLLLGGLIGGLAGGASAWWSYDRLFETQILGSMRLGQYRLSMGPMKDRNFPYILLGRGVYYLYRLATLSHAWRHDLVFEIDESFRRRWMDENLQRKLERLHKQFRQDAATEEALKAYADLIASALRRLLRDRKESDVRSVGDNNDV